MEQLVWLVPLGFAVGAFGTLIGAGGGFILMPILLFAYPHSSAEVLTAVSLAVISGNAVSGSVAYARMRRINYKAGLLFAAAAAPGAVLGALLIDIIPRKPFNILFGSVLLAVGLFILFGKGNRSIANSAATEVNLDKRKLTIGTCLSFGVGILSSLLGIGGGIIHVPVLIYLLNFPVHIATATSQFILAIMTLVGTGVHIIDGSIGKFWFMVLGLLIGVILGAQAGAYLSKQINGKWITKIFAIALILASARIITLA